MNKRTLCLGLGDRVALEVIVILVHLVPKAV